MIWFMKRKRWRIGPKLPFAYDRLCTTSLSRTLVLIVSIDFGNHSYNPGQEMIGRVVLFDFHTKNWSDAPTISIPPYYWMDCKMTVNFDKTGNQEAVALINGKMIHHNLFRLSYFSSSTRISPFMNRRVKDVFLGWKASETK